MKKSLFRCLLFVLIGLSHQGVAQEGEVTKSNISKTISGKKYLIHTVAVKQTLYSIAKVYGVTISEITFENPDVLQGIKPGQELKIPETSQTPASPTPAATQPASTSSNANFHTVLPSETLYGIAKLYNISLEELKELNPEVAAGVAIRIGQQLKVKGVKQPESNQTSNGVDETNKSSVNFVTLLLPFYLNENTFNDSTETKVADNSRNAIEFYEGTLMAIDSLKQLGINYNVSVYDVVSDTSVAKSILTKPNVKNSQLIIGPFYNSTFEPVARFARENKIPVVSPMIQNSKILLGNPTVSKVIPNNASQCETMAEYIATSLKEANVILIHNGQTNELNLVNAFKNKYKTILPEKAVLVKEVNYKTASFTGVQSELQIAKENIVVVFSSEQVFVSQLLPKLDNKRDDYKITVFGQAIWKNFENIEADVFSKLHLHLPANFYVDYDNIDVKNFIRKFREKYQAEPGQMAFLGYDICYYYLNLLNNRGLNFHTTLWQTKGQGLSTGFEFFRENAEKGYENKATSIIKYDDNKLLKVK